MRFGPPVVPGADEHRTDVMERVRSFYEACGAQTTVDKRIAAQRRPIVATVSAQTADSRVCRGTPLGGRALRNVRARFIKAAGRFSAATTGIMTPKV